MEKPSEVKAPPSPEAKKEPTRTPLSRRGFLRVAGATATGLALAETGLGALLSACASAPPDRHSYRRIPDTLTDPNARMYWERFEFQADTRNGRITISLTDAGRRAIYPGTQINGEWVQWEPNLDDLYNAASMHADLDGFSVDYERFAAGLIGKYGTPDPQHPEKETILMQKGNKYVLNPKSEFAIFELPGDCFRKKESDKLPESAAQPAEPPPAAAVESSAQGPPAEPTLDPTDVAQWLEDIQRGNATATPNLSAGTPMPDQKTTALLPVGVSNSSLRRFITYVCGIPLAAGAALVGGWKLLLRRMAGGKTETYVKGYNPDEETGTEGKVETTNVTYGEPDPIASVAATPRASSQTPSSAPSSKREAGRQILPPSDSGNQTRPWWEPVPQKKYSTSQIIKDTEKRYARLPDRLPRALAFWEKWFKDHPDQVTEDRPASERVVDA